MREEEQAARLGAQAGDGEEQVPQEPGQRRRRFAQPLSLAEATACATGRANLCPHVFCVRAAMGAVIAAASRAPARCHILGAARMDTRSYQSCVPPQSAPTSSARNRATVVVAEPSGTRLRVTPFSFYLRSQASGYNHPRACPPHHRYLPAGGARLALREAEREPRQVHADEDVGADADGPLGRGRGAEREGVHVRAVERLNITKTASARGLVTAPLRGVCGASGAPLPIPGRSLRPEPLVGPEPLRGLEPAGQPPPAGTPAWRPASRQGHGTAQSRPHPSARRHPAEQLPRCQTLTHPRLKHGQ